MRLTFIAGKRILAAATLVVASGGLVACGGSNKSASSGTPTKANTGPVIIGQAFAESGYLQVFDQPVNRGLQLGVDKINAEGGINGRKVKLVTVDTASDLARAQTGAQQLLQDGASVVVPSADASIALPVAQTVGAHGVISMAGIGSPMFGFKGGGPYAFNLYQGEASEVGALAQFAHSKGIKRPFLLVDQINDYTKSYCGLFAQAWKNLGGKIAGQDTFQASDQQLSSQVTQIKSSNPDAVVLCSVPPGGVSAIRQIRAALPTVTLLGDGAFEGDFWLSAAPHLSNFYYPAMVSLVQKSAALQGMIAAYKQKFGSPPPSATFPAFGYSIVEALRDAAKVAGSTSGPKLAKALNQFKDQPLLVGPTTYSPSCHVPLGRPQPFVKIANGKSTVITSISSYPIPDRTC